MPEFPIRRIAVLAEETFHEGGPLAAVPRRQPAAMALVKNLFAGHGRRPDEILFCLVMACGARVHDRMGGLAAADIKAWDGLR